jgi:RecA-family ATPase
MSTIPELAPIARDPQRAKALQQALAGTPEGDRLLAELFSTNVASGGLPTTNGMELYARQYPPREFLLDGLIARGDCVLLAGRPKSGKSWLLLQMAAAIDTGSPFLGRQTKRGGVLFVTLEDGERRIHERLHVRKWQPTASAFAFGLLPLTDGGVGQIEQSMGGFSAVFIDTLRAACGPDIDENDNAAMGHVVQSLANLAHRNETAIVISHHVRKGEAEDPFDLIRGAGAIRGAYDTGIVIQRKPKEAEAVLHIEARDIEADDMTIRFDGATGWSYEGDGQRIVDIRAGRAVLRALHDLGDDQPTEAVAEKLGISKEAARKQLTSALGQRLVARRDEQAERGKKPRDLWSLVCPGT